MSEHETISTETIIAVVSGVATQEESNRVFAAAVTDADLRMRLALSLPSDTEDDDIAEAITGDDRNATGKGLE